MTRRSLLRLLSWFLIAEDPQRRLDASEVASLAHQASLVRHVLSDPTLRNVLIADEVGLGKTVEAGLIVRELLEQSSKLRVLYLAPARLVRNVEREFRQLGLGFRIWVAGADSDARLSDGRVIASIHRSVSPAHFEQFSQTRWDVIIVDECHHLSNYSREGHSPLRKYRLVDDLRARLSPEGRLILLSGTPHQGHPYRFNNLLRLLQHPKEGAEAVAGRVIYRTKEDVSDWRGQPLFPTRDVRAPLVVDLGEGHRTWLRAIHGYFESNDGRDQNDAGRRAATWRCAQALQWATSSIEAGLGYLVRQAVRAGCDLSLPHLREALMELRPYRGGTANESAADVLARITKEVRRQTRDADVEDIEEAPDEDEEPEGWVPDPERLSVLLQQGVGLLAEDPSAKWDFLWEKENLPTPVGLSSVPFGLLFYAKQTLRLTGADPVETALGLHAHAVDLEHSVALDSDARARIVRALLDATVRQRPEEAPLLVTRLREVDQRILRELRQPTEVELENQVRHVVYPLLAAVVG